MTWSLATSPYPPSALSTAAWRSIDQAIAWRRYMLACAACHCVQLEGDFVECGVYQGTGVKTVVGRTGCMGMCFCEVMVEVAGRDGRRFVYGNVTPAMAPRIVEEHVIGGEPIKEWLVLRDGARAGRHADELQDHSSQHR